MVRKILFLTGTRADFGKLKPLISQVAQADGLQYMIFVTGMHTLAKYGYTVSEVRKAGFENIHVFMNQIYDEPMDMILANTIEGLSRFVHEYKPDMIVVHGDRVEAMAGAIVGALNNILVAHIEGGEVSGTIDEIIRHAVSKLSHIHFVANEDAAARLRQLGEDPSAIFIIGSPDVDIMLSPDLPQLSSVKARYQIPFEDYAIVLFHPVTTELDTIRWQTEQLVSALIESRMNYVVVYPNNDAGSNEILYAYQSLQGLPQFRMFPSLRFEYFLSLLKHARFIIGSSSAGVREAPVYGVPCINIGTRQQNRFRYKTILDVESDKTEILIAIREAAATDECDRCLYFGRGDSAKLFVNVLKEEKTWMIPKQKRFHDVIQTRSLRLSRQGVAQKVYIEKI